MPEPALKIVSRNSRLAVLQVDEVLPVLQSCFPGTAFERIEVSSPGDRNLAVPLSDASVPNDFFTRDVDEAILNGTADLSVHSAKDLPEDLHPDLFLAALLPAKDIRDVLVYRNDFKPGDAVQTLGVSSDRREAYLQETFPEAELKSLRGTIQQRIDQADAGQFDAIITAACALDRLGLSDRISSYLPYDPSPQQGRLAIVIRKDRTDLADALKPVDIIQNAGLVALVGCPSDEALITERARSYLEHADVVIHDRLIPDRILLSIQHKAISVGKADGTRSIPQSEIHRIMLEQAEQGSLVVRLQGGDPLIFGRLGQELQFLNEWNIRTDIVTSVTAAQVAAARASSPLTHRDGGRAITIISGRPADLPVADRLPGPDDGSLAIYMGAKRFEELQQRLYDAGWNPSSPVVVGERIGYKDEWVHTTTLGQAISLEPEAPSVFLVGVNTYQPVQRTLFTGTNPGGFLKYGPLIHWPVIKLIPAPLKSRAEQLDSLLVDCDGIVFPGPFAVEVFIEALLEKYDARALKGKQLIAVSQTVDNTLRRYGLKADRVTTDFEALGDGPFLYPCSDTGPNDPMPANLETTVFYHTRATAFCDLPRIPFKRVIFTSRLTVDTYFEQHPDEKQADRTWLATGPSTLSAIQEMGLSGSLLSTTRLPA